MYGGRSVNGRYLIGEAPGEALLDDDNSIDVKKIGLAVYKLPPGRKIP
jgi:hypothetical protein